MVENKDTVTIQCLKVMLRPLVRYCLKRSIQIREFVESLKEVYLSVAEEELVKMDKKVSAGKLSVFTGIHRKDVARLSAETPERKEANDIPVRVMSTWHTDSRFTTAKGKPRTLTYGTNDSEFAELVRSVSSDVKAGAVLSQLELIGQIRYTARGIRAVSPGFVPRDDVVSMYDLLGADMDDLIISAQQNIEQQHDFPNYHLKTEYDNIAQRAVPQIRYFILKEATEFHRKIMRYVSQFDKDVNKELANEVGGARVAVIGFSRIQDDSDSEEVTQEVA